MMHVEPIGNGYRLEHERPVAAKLPDVHLVSSENHGASRPEDGYRFREAKAEVQIFQLRKQFSLAVERQTRLSIFARAFKFWYEPTEKRLSPVKRETQVRILHSAQALLGEWAKPLKPVFQIIARALFLEASREETVIPAPMPGVAFGNAPGVWHSEIVVRFQRFIVASIIARFTFVAS